MSPFYLAALTFGFLGSLHCAGMCGGLIGALSMGSGKSWNPGIFIYQIGRIATYATLGLAAGILGSSLDKIGGAKFQMVVAILTGLLMVGFGLNMLGAIPDPLIRLTSTLIRLLKIGKRSAALAKNPNWFGWFSGGLVNGLLPCGLVYAALSLALAAENPLAGGATMLFFGVGTMPAMLLTPAIMRQMKPSIRGNILKIVGVLMIIYGIFTGLRGSDFLPFMKKHNMHNHSEISHINQQNEMCLSDKYIIKNQ